MEVIRHCSPEALREKIEPLLLEKEAENNLFLGLLKLYTEKPELQREDHIWLTVEHDGEVLLGAWRTPPFQFGLWSPVENHEPAVRCFVGYLKKHEMEIPGVVARKDVADLFSSVVKEILDLVPYFNMGQGIYECRQVKPSLTGKGVLRTARPEELDLLTDWMIAFYGEALKQEPIRSEAREKLTGEIARGAYFFYLEDGNTVSTAAATRSMINGITVNMVYTPPEFRNRGYATACVALLTQKLLDSGWKFTSLYTDLKNPASNSIYRKIGYRWVCQSTELRFRPAQIVR